jgi:hypothetical protein
MDLINQRAGGNPADVNSHLCWKIVEAARIRLSKPATMRFGQPLDSTLKAPALTVYLPVGYW